MRLAIESPEEMERLAASYAESLPAGFNLYLQGELGAGKTTFVRGMLRGLGYRGVVRSPTYTLVEHYRVAGRMVYHFDLYRFATANELHDIGSRDYFDGAATCLVEWPEQGRDCLPAPDITIDIAIEGARRDLDCHAHSAAGEKYLQRLGVSSAIMETTPIQGSG